MHNIHSAIDCWTRLLIELGTTAHTRTPSPFGEIARHRVKALQNLYYALIVELKPRALLEIGAHNAETSRKFVELVDGFAHAYEAGEEVYNRVVAGGYRTRKHVSLCYWSVEWASGVFRACRGSTEGLGLNQKTARFRIYGQITVPMCTLDTAAAKFEWIGHDRDLALWIDVEGAGLDVLASGIIALKARVSLVFIEVNDVETYADSATALGHYRLAPILWICGDCA